MLDIVEDDIELAVKKMAIPQQDIDIPAILFEDALGEGLLSPLNACFLLLAKQLLAKWEISQISQMERFVEAVVGSNLAKSSTLISQMNSLAPKNYN